ncbi:MAG: hypothetical protein RL630_273 [Verrucomicrobiota bacterium]
MNCALEKDFKFQAKPANTTEDMKKIIPILLAAIAFSYSSRAALITYNATQNVVTTGTSFSFSKFNPTLGTLSAIDLIINSSTPGGNVNVTNNSASAMDVDAVESRFRLTSNATLGISAYSSAYTALTTSPASNPLTIAGSGSQLFAISGGQSLLGGSPVTRSVSSSAFAQYQGSGNITYLTNVQNQIDTLGEDYAVSSVGYFALTSLTLQYTYTPAPPSPVPEPGQVAASLLVVGGMGIYFLRRRRKVAAL